MNNTNSLIDQANYSLEAAKADLDLHAAELEAAQARYNEAKTRYDDAMHNFLEADLLRVCRWNQMVSLNSYVVQFHDYLRCQSYHDVLSATMLAVSQTNSMERRSQRRYTRAHIKGFN